MRKSTAMARDGTPQWKGPAYSRTPAFDRRRARRLRAAQVGTEGWSPAEQKDAGASHFRFPRAVENSGSGSRL